MNKKVTRTAKCREDVSKMDLGMLKNITEAAITFKDKVNRDAPSCFTPSPELQNLFDTIEEFMNECG